jgi:hypothetical protein
MTRIGTSVSARYFATDVTFNATDCEVTIPHTQIECISAAGYAGNLTWQITVNGSIGSLSLPIVLTYATPTISNIYTSTSSMLLSSQGGTVITIEGNNFGSRTPEIELMIIPSTSSSSSYLASNEYFSTNCILLVNHTRLSCVVPAGAGNGLAFTIRVHSIVSNSYASSFTYDVPTITTIDPTTLTNYISSSITITGTNFGPLGLNFGLTLRYGPSLLSSTNMCYVQTAQTVIICSSNITSCGQSTGIILSIGGQSTSFFSSTKLSYPPLSGGGAPVITDIQPSLLSTDGTTSVTITGTYLGFCAADTATQPTLNVEYGKDNSIYEAIGCASISPTTIVCLSTWSGTDKNHKWRVAIIDGGDFVQGDWSTVTTSFSAPIIQTVTPNSLNTTMLLSTSVNSDITITGTSFGSANPITILVGSITTTCSLVTPHTLIVCNLPPQVGGPYQIVLTAPHGVVVVALPEFMLQYQAPTITSVTSDEIPSLHSFGTAGGQLFTITGTSFGASIAKVNVTYIGGVPNRVRYVALCSWGIPQTQVICMMGTGLGCYLQVFINIDGQVATNPLYTLSYARPVISILGVSDRLARTGNGTFGPIGANFGPAAGPSLVLRYYSNSIPHLIFTSQPCNNIDGDSGISLDCRASPGLGSSLLFVITVGGQTITTPFGPTTAGYQPHLVTTIQIGSSIDTPLPCNQSVLVNIVGIGFGLPSWNLPLAVRYGPSALPTLYTATSCVVKSDTLIQCMTASFGVGKSLVWGVTLVDKTASPGHAIDYDTPKITAILNDINTDGSSLVTLQGSCFGPLSRYDLLLCFFFVHHERY